MPKKEFKPLKSILSMVIEHHGLEHSIQNIQIFQKWPEIVGSSIAKQCKPVSIEDDTLYVEINNQIWRTELARRQRELVTLLDKNIIHNHIKKIKLI